MSEIAEKLAIALILFWTLCLAWQARDRISTLEEQVRWYQHEMSDAEALCIPPDTNYPSLQIDPIPDRLLDAYEYPL